MTDLVKRLRAWADLMANVELLDLFDAAAPGRFAQLDAQEVARGLREAALHIEKLEARQQRLETAARVLLNSAEVLRVGGWDGVHENTRWKATPCLADLAAALEEK